MTRLIGALFMLCQMKLQLGRNLYTRYNYAKLCVYKAIVVYVIAERTDDNNALWCFYF